MYMSPRTVWGVHETNHTNENNGVKPMKKVILLSAIAISALMVGCSSTETRECDGNADCKPALCEDAANCDPSKCDKPDCAKKAQACADGAKACPSEAKADCAQKKACDADKKAASCPTGKK